MNNDKMVSVPFKALRDFLEHSACTYKGPEWTKNKAALRHAMSKGLVIPKDWAIVPVKPTREMVLAGHEAYKNAPCDEALIIYSTMLGCAPDAPGDVTREMNDELADLRALLLSMTCSYAQVVQAGYDRITALGGDCDGVQKMLSDFPDYAKARAILEIKP